MLLYIMLPGMLFTTTLSPLEDSLKSALNCFQEQDMDFLTEYLLQSPKLNIGA